MVFEVAGGAGEQEGSSHKSSWSVVTEEMVGGQHQTDEATQSRA